ncbi:unnamed protein product [Phytomonas sp. Hart1]|nr:unnamed protein product [Phytomonas sp. Hart1]|eukprot:CCW68453.1 unnamed protein product [Phytomonas sp. isolate Hart1]
MQLCPKCHGSTSTYISVLPFDKDRPSSSRHTASPPRARILAEGEIDQYFSTDHGENFESPVCVSGRSGTRSALKPSTESTENPKKRANFFIQEKMALHDELKQTKVHMMRKAFEILSLHDNVNASKRSTLELIEKLHSDNRTLRQRLGHLEPPLVANDVDRIPQIEATPEDSAHSHSNPLGTLDNHNCVLSITGTSTSEDKQPSLTNALKEITRLRALLKENDSKNDWVAERVKKAEKALDTLVVHLNAAEATTQAGGEADKILNQYAITDIVNNGEVDHFLSTSLAKSYAKLHQHQNLDKRHFRNPFPIHKEAHF